MPWMRIAVLGPGAVGGLLAALLARAGEDVVLVGRRPGPVELEVTSPAFGDLRATVAMVQRLDEPADALLVAVKAPALGAALERVAAAPGIAVPLLNGVEHVAVLRERFPDVVAGTVRVQAHRDGVARIVHRAPFLTVTVAAPGAAGLEAALRGAGVEVDAGRPEPDVLWGKLARLCGLALATAAADAPLGAVREDARAVSREVVAVANADGAAIDAATVVAELDGLPDAASSSLRADIAAGAPDDERDAIAGAVLRAAARHGLPCPRTQALLDALP